MTSTDTLLRRDEAEYEADAGAEIVPDECGTCQGSGELVGLSCPLCAGEGTLYRIAGYSERLASLVAECDSILAVRR